MLDQSNSIDSPSTTGLANPPASPVVSSVYANLVRLIIRGSEVARYVLRDQGEEEHE
jgi:hypothetical protein